MFDDNRISQYREAQKQKPLFAKPLYPTETDMLMNYISASAKRVEKNPSEQADGKQKI